ncbi:MAG: SusC/RagA family TonB-linked outer membrane protein [Ferruginibacter sp.]|nr:SusC/RagA family TonB-linked outer membrane protein [Ferruginibacter sp.]
MKQTVNLKRPFNSGKAFPKPVLLSIVILLQLFLFSGRLFSQNITVKGQVLKEGDQPVQSASVMVKGSAAGTTTDGEGNFQLAVPANGTLVISALDFVSQEIKVAGRTAVSISLISQNKSLGEVVVVGYGTQRKKDVTGAVASVNLESMKEAPNTNIGQLLQGTVPGLNVGLSTTAGGTPPINIRGQNSLNGNQSVLIILDGIQYTQSLSSINPDDIASIDVLKDASSTAVYGAQAANGVILITTRKGRNLQRPRISFSSSYSIQNPTKDLKPMNLEQYLQNIKDANWDTAYLKPDFTQPNPRFDVKNFVDASMAYPGRTALLPNNFDWWNASTNTGKIIENNLSFSGGNDRFNYLLSGGYVDQSGFIINDKFKRKSIRVNLETKPFTWWKVGLVSSGAFVNQDGAEPAIGNVIQASPLLVPFDSAGNLIPSPTNTLVPNPFQTYYVDDYDRNNYYFANIYTDIDFPFLKGLNYRMNFGNNYRTSERFFSSAFGASLQGQAFKNNQSYYDYTFDNILTYTKSFKKHDFTTTLLYGAVERKFNSTGAEGRVFTRLNLSYNNLGQGTNAFVTSSAYQENLNYQMARVNYKFNDKYLLTATIRRDGFSGFAENFKYGYFPTAALGWIISQENFMSTVKAVNFLKFRVGFGVSGNQTSRYSSIPTVSTTPWVPSPPNNNFAFPYVFGDGGTTAAAQQVTALGNPDLKWERTKGLNAGVDFTLLNNRLSGSLDYYRNNTTDLLFSVNIPTVTGFSSIQTNLGQLRNTGFEVNLTYKVIDQKDFKWSATINFWKNTNSIIHLTGQDVNPADGIEDDLIGSGLFIGKSRYTIYDYQYNGIYNQTETRLPGFTVGSYRIADQDKNNTITDKDRIFLGRREPAYQMSFYNIFSYKALSVSFFINTIQGGKDGFLGNNNPSYFRDDNGIRNNYLAGIDYWSPANPTGKYMRNISGARSYNEVAGLNNWQDRSFVRLQDASISYNLGSVVLKKVKAQSVNIFVSGKNLITWTNWEGWDPEPVSTDGQNNAAGGWLGTRPVMRAFTVGLNITY